MVQRRGVDVVRCEENAGAGRGILWRWLVEGEKGVEERKVVAASGLMKASMADGEAQAD